MYDTWDEFPVADAVDEGDVPMEDQLVGYLLELTTLKLSGKGGSLLAERQTSTSAPTGEAASSPDDTKTTEPKSATEKAPVEIPAEKKDDASPSPTPEPEATPKETK